MRLRFLQYLPNQFCLLAVLLLPNTVIGQLEPIDSEVKASYGTAPAALDHSTQTALLSQIDTAIERLKAVRATRGGTSESSSLDLALNMLEISKAQVLGKLSAKDAEPQLANAMEAVQTQINHLRIIAAN